MPALKGLFYSSQDRALSLLVLQNRGLRPEPSACVTHVPGLCVTYVPGLSPSLDRVRGTLALRLGLTEEAEGHYQNGLDWAERERCPVEAGRCLHGLARVAQHRGKTDKVAELLDRAAIIFEQHDALFYLGRVREQQGGP